MLLYTGTKSGTTFKYFISRREKHACSVSVASTVQLYCYFKQKNFMDRSISQFASTYRKESRKKYPQSTIYIENANIIAHVLFEENNVQDQTRFKELQYWLDHFEILDFMPFPSCTLKKDLKSHKYSSLCPRSSRCKNQQ